MNWVAELTSTPFVSMFPLHSCIVFLCQLLLFPQWNFFLPAFLNQLFLAFELRFILCTLAYSYWLTPGSWQKISGSAWRWRLHFLSRGGPGEMSSSSLYVWEIPTPVKGPLWLCTDQQQHYQWFLWLTMWAIVQSLDFAAVTWCSRLLYKCLRFYCTVRVCR